MEDGDEIVVLRVVEPGSSSTKVAGDTEEARQEAQEVMDSIMDKNGDERMVRRRRRRHVDRVELTSA